MSIKVLSVPTSYKVDCPFCKASFSFTREDVTNDMFCPVCGMKISIRNLAGELSSLVEPLFADYNDGFSFHTT